MSPLEGALKVVFREAVREVIREELRGAAPGGDGPEYVTAKEAGKLVSVSAATIRKWYAQGLPSYGRGHIRVVKVSELRVFLEQQAASKVAEPRNRVAEIVASLPRKAVR